jgi:rod shape determining protein RodA
LNLRFLKELDTWLLLGSLLLIGFGLLLLYAATSTDDGALPSLFKKQVLWAVVGIALMIFTAVLSPRVHFTFAYLFYGFCCLLLLIVLFWGSQAKGAARWIDLRVFTFQPSEPAKIALILALARLVTDKKYDPSRISHLLRAALLTALPLALVLAQPDLGTSMVFAALFFFIIIAVGTPYAYLLVLISPFIAALAAIKVSLLVAYIAFLILASWKLRFRLFFVIFLVVINLGISLGAPHFWNQLKPYQKNRLVSFVQPEADPRGSGYQVLQSKVAIGSGGLTGKGLGEGSQTQLKFLPEQHTDFIFSVLGEELGFFGASSALLLFALLIYRGFKAAQKTKGRYSALVCAGLTSMLTFHIFINIGMTVGLMPVTGLPLPLLSYGGSFLWTVMISLGLIFGIQRRWKEYTP